MPTVLFVRSSAVRSYIQARRRLDLCLRNLLILKETLKLILLLSRNSPPYLMNHLLNGIVTNLLAKKVFYLSRGLLEAVIHRQHTARLCQGRTQLLAAKPACLIVWSTTCSTLSTVVISPLQFYPAQEAVDISAAVLDKFHPAAAGTTDVTTMVAVSLSAHNPLQGGMP